MKQNFKKVFTSPQRTGGNRVYAERSLSRSRVEVGVIASAAKQSVDGITIKTSIQH